MSVGIALTDAARMDLDDEDAASMLISNADTAIYRSKQNGRAPCTIFTPPTPPPPTSRTPPSSEPARWNIVFRDRPDIDR